MLIHPWLSQTVNYFWTLVSILFYVVGSPYLLFYWLGDTCSTNSLIIGENTRIKYYKLCIHRGSTVRGERKYGIVNLINKWVIIARVAETLSSGYEHSRFWNALTEGFRRFNSIPVFSNSYNNGIKHDSHGLLFPDGRNDYLELKKLKNKAHFSILRKLSVLQLDESLQHCATRINANSENFNTFLNSIACKFYSNCVVGWGWRKGI